MDRLDKIKLAIEKGFTYDHITGNIYGIKGKVITRKCRGYIDINVLHNGKSIHISGHQFAYYWVHKRIVDYIDHRDGNKSNNSISNLREVTQQQNNFNRKCKGYYFNNSSYVAQIGINGVNINLGSFKSEKEARQAYLDAKKIYHRI